MVKKKNIEYIGMFSVFQIILPGATFNASYLKISLIGNISCLAANTGTSCFAF